MTCLNLSNRAGLLLFMIAHESSATLHYYLSTCKVQTRTRGVAVAQKQVLQGLLSTNASKAAATATATAASSASTPTVNLTSEVEASAAGTANTAGTVLSGKVNALTITPLIDRPRALQFIELHCIALYCHYLHFPQASLLSMGSSMHSLSLSHSLLLSISLLNDKC